MGDERAPRARGILRPRRENSGRYACTSRESRGEAVTVSKDSWETNGAYKGHDYWREIGKQVIRLVRKVTAVSFHDARADEWFQRHSHFADSTQWLQALRGFLLPDATKRYPPSSDWADGIVLVEFVVPTARRGIVYICDRGLAHCATDRAITRERVSLKRRAQVLRRLREKLGVLADECPACSRRLENDAYQGVTLGDTPQEETPTEISTIEIQKELSQRTGERTRDKPYF